MIDSTWTRQQVQDLLQNEQFRYHRIELPHGFATEGRDRSDTARLIFPEDLTGKTVLDLGCAEGYFTFEAKRRGASRVVGLDVESDVIRRNRILADCLNLDVEFGVFNLERERLSEKYDYVLCLNVLHHLTDPLSVLENLTEIARERLVLEMATLGAHDQRRLGIFPVWGYLLSKAPVIYVSGRATRGRKLKKYFFTMGAIRNVLRHHRRIFANVQLKPSEHKGRFVVLAERYNINHLIVVAGPTASGMTEFAKGLRSGEHSEVAKQIGIDGSMVYLDTERAGGSNEANINTAVISYDILRAYLRTGSVYERDELLDILACAKKVTVVTLWRDPSILRNAFDDIGYNRFIWRWQTKRQRNIMASYAEDKKIISHYDRWFTYLESAGFRPYVLIMDENQIKLATSETWRKMVTSTST